MLPVSSKQTVEFTPPDAMEREPRPVFRLQVPTLLQRAQWRRALNEHGATYPSDAQLLAALREDLRAINPGNLDQLLEQVDAFEAAVDGEKLKLAPDMLAFETLCRGIGGAYSQALARRGYWGDLAPLVAAQMFVVGWEHAGPAFKRGHDGVDHDALAALPDAWLRSVGWKAIGLMTLSGDAEKNSAAPSSSPDAPATSTVH